MNFKISLVILIYERSETEQKRHHVSGMCWSSLKQKLHKMSKAKTVTPWHFEKRQSANRPKITLDSVTLGWAKQYFFNFKTKVDLNL